MHNGREWRIVFMGTPDFGLPSLRALKENGYNVISVVTQPDRPRGRGHKMVPSPVKECALELGIPVKQFDKISGPDGISWLKANKPDLLITAAFGQILSEELLDIPPLGCINVHASLLPRYRGASPIVWSIINGDKLTGVTTMYTVKALDAGPILEQDSVAILPAETGGELAEKLSILGARTLLTTLEHLEQGTLMPREQDESEATYYTQLPRGFGQIDWSQTSDAILRFVRALAPYPGAFLVLPSQERVYVYSASMADYSGHGIPGDILAANPKEGLLVQTQDGVLSLDTIKRANSKVMSAKESLRGRAIEPGHLPDKS